jgi:hypothetical protein
MMFGSCSTVMRHQADAPTPPESEFQSMADSDVFRQEHSETGNLYPQGRVSEFERTGTQAYFFQE